MRRTLGFQEPGSQQTLREGLAEFRASLSDEDRQDGALARDLWLHDACHVVFGLGTSVSDDAVVDAWIVFGTDVHARSYLRALWNSRALGTLVERDGVARVVAGLVRAIPRVVSTLRRARKMPRKWPWSGADRYLDSPLVEIRSDYGIRLT